MIDSTADIIRLINLGLCGLVLVLMATRWRVFVAMQRGALMLAIAFVTLVLATAWATVETLASRVTAPGIRSWIIMLALAWAIAALVMLWRDRR